MKKIMFDDKFGLTEAVLNGKKTKSLKYKKMIQTRINHADISWEEFPILAFNPELNVIIIALENGDYLKGTVVNSDNPEHPIGKYYEYWEKSQFCPFEDEVILKNKSK